MTNTIKKIGKGLAYLSLTGMFIFPSCAQIRRIESNAKLTLNLIETKTSVTMNKVEWEMRFASNNMKRNVNAKMNSIEQKVDSKMNSIERKVDFTINQLQNLYSPFRKQVKNINTNSQDKPFFDYSVSAKEKNTKKITQKKFNKISFNKYTPKIEYRNGATKTDKKAKFYLSQIEKVPDQIQKIIENEGGKIVFFNGPLTYNPEMNLMKGIRPQNWKHHTYDDLSACHDPASQLSFLGINGNYFGEGDHSLHEYSHNYDYQIGWHFFSKPLSKTKKVLKAIIKEPFKEEYYNHPQEYIANSIEKFYHSTKTRKILKKNNPTIHKILSSLELKALNNSQN